ncbi:hypothetical protein T492DRAFT_833490 [Pavlovales sp. CCMP2436]|nr:hypothetical protein T492DRAFT_833490 [Pavlovales sp. CCMP2436]
MSESDRWGKGFDLATRENSELKSRGRRTQLSRVRRPLLHRRRALPRLPPDHAGRAVRGRRRGALRRAAARAARRTDEAVREAADHGPDGGRDCLMQLLPPRGWLWDARALRQLKLNHDAEDAAVAMKRAAGAAAAAAAAAAARRKAKLLAQIARSPIEPPSAEQLRDNNVRCAQLAIDATMCETLRQQAAVLVPATQTRHVVAALAASVSARGVRAALRAAGVRKQRAAAALFERAHDGTELLCDLATADYAFGGAPTPALSPAAAAHAARTFDVLTYITYTEIYGQAPPHRQADAHAAPVRRGGLKPRAGRGAPLVDRLELLAPIVARLRALRRAEGVATDPAVPRLSARRAVLSARAALRRLELPPAQNPNLARPPVKDPTLSDGGPSITFDKLRDASEILRRTLLSIKGGLHTLMHAIHATNVTDARSFLTSNDPTQILTEYADLLLGLVTYFCELAFDEATASGLDPDAVDAEYVHSFILQRAAAHPWITKAVEFMRHAELCLMLRDAETDEPARHRKRVRLHAPLRGGGAAMRLHLPAGPGCLPRAHLRRHQVGRHRLRRPLAREHEPLLVRAPREILPQGASRPLPVRDALRVPALGVAHAPHFGRARHGLREAAAPCRLRWHASPIDLSGRPFYDSVAFRAARSAARAAGLGGGGPSRADAMPLVTPRAGATAVPLDGPEDLRSPTGQKLNPDWLRDSTLAPQRWEAYFKKYYVDSYGAQDDAVESDKLAEFHRKRHTTVSKDDIMNTPQIRNELFCTVPFMAAQLTMWRCQGYRGVPTEQAVKTAAGRAKDAMAKLYLRTIRDCVICRPTYEELRGLYSRATIRARSDGAGYRLELGAEFYYTASAPILTLRPPPPPAPPPACRPLAPRGAAAILLWSPMMTISSRVQLVAGTNRRLD